MHKFAPCAMLALTTTLGGLTTSAQAQDIAVTDLGHTLVLPGQPASQSPATIFPDTNYASSVSEIFCIRNESQTTPLEVTGVTVDGAHPTDFAVFGLPATVPPGQTFEFDIVFQPTAYGYRSANITLQSNDPDQPAYSFEVAGVATLETTEKPDLGISGNGVVTKTKKNGSTQVKASAVFFNSGHVNSEPTVISLYRSQKPYFDTSAELVGMKRVKNVKATPVQKPIKYKKVKFKYNSQDSSGYLFWQIFSASPTGQDTDWHDNSDSTGFPIF